MSEASAVIPAQAGIQENDLPKGWQLVELEKICTVDNGRGFKKTEWKSEGLPIIRIQNLKDDEADFNYFAGELDDKHKVKAGDLLFAWSGTPGTSFGAHIWHGPDAALNQHIFNVRFDKEKVDPKYFYFALNQNVARYVAQAQGGVGLAHITKGKFMASKIPLMSVEQQKRIVAKIEELFSHIDAGIEALKKAKQLLKQYRQSVLKAAVTGELTKEWREANKYKLEPASQLLERLRAERKEEFERKMNEWEHVVDSWKKLGEKGKKPSKPKKITLELDISKNVSQDSLRIPGEWVKINLDFAVSKLGDGLHGTPKYSEGEYYFINGNNLSDGEILIKPETKTVSKIEADKHYRELNDRTVLVSINGTLGNIAFYEGENVILGKSACYFNILPSFSKDYVRWILESNEFKVYAEKTATGSTIKNIPLKAMREFIIPLCSPHEQSEIVRIVEEKLSSIEHLNTEIDQQLVKAERNKHSVLASAFSGNIK